MRTNLPVTNNEYILQDSETIVSKTDLKGRITYVNQDFLHICGFSEEELMGKPHNIVRHPDMPEEAFDDMWRTLKWGKAWTGLVKNRCKNGDYYWVEANVAPLMENHQIVGYTSIRGKPTRDQVKAAGDAYRAIKSGDKRLVIREGGAFARSPLDFLKVLKDFSITAKLSMAFGVLFLLSIINAIFAWSMQDGASLNLAGWAITVATLSMILTVFFGLMLFKSIVAPLKNVSIDIERMTSGDLTGKIMTKGEDEIAKVVQSLQVLQINVKLLIGQLIQSIDLVNCGASEIADGVLDLSARTESQASSLEETATAMEELTATVQQNSDNAHQASDLVISTATIAVKGGEAVSHVVSTMNSIQESSNKIVDIISVIDGIAFQTNILALNAAVEAARAGEQGRGFAVVAAEVRSLAQRSASAAKEIKTLIGDSVERVEVGSQLVDDAGKTMTEIVDSIKRAAAIMGEISTSSQEQSAGIGQVHQAITEMDAITQQNASLVEQAAAAAATMKEQADNLSQLVGAFKLMSGGRVSRSQSTGKVTKRTNKSTMNILPSRPNQCLSIESRH